MPNFNINEFKSIIEKNGELLHPNKFMVRFPTPNGLANSTTSSVTSDGRLSVGITGDDKTMSYYCKSAVVPGIGIDSNTISKYGYGPLERFAKGTLVNDVIFNFYVDANNQVKTFFIKWMRLITGAHSQYGMTTDLGNGRMPYEISYKEDYCVDLSISTYDQQGTEINRTTLIDAWPNYIGDVSVDWQDKNNFMLLPIAFTYRDWYEDTIPL